MRIALATIATLGLSLAACERAPADGTAEEPAPQVTTQAPADVAVPAQTEAAPYDGPIPKPIRVGLKGPNMDSCASYGEVYDLESGGETYLSVRDAPSTQVKERDRLDPGQGVHICSEDGDWFGVVYDKGDEGKDCQVDETLDTPRNYTGPCAQGWVEAKYVNVTAG
ncbi:hypothetical protein AAG602_07030 [Citromicrobium bathyomarinum]